MTDPTPPVHSEKPFAADVSAVLARLFVYPVKSCAGIELTESRLLATGLEHDRAFMLVDSAGEFVSQRDLPRMALIRPRFDAGELVLQAPDMDALRVSLAASGALARVRVRVWNDVVAAFDVGDSAARWFSTFLSAGAPASMQVLRLVRFDPRERRLSSQRWTGGVEAPNLFADGYPLLVASEASVHGLNERLVAAGHGAVGIERFRPNVVLADVDAHDEDRFEVLRIGADGGAAEFKLVKPCVRCPIPNIDPATARSSPEVGDALQQYRQNDATGGGVTFGMNAIVVAGVGSVLRVGQPGVANWRFD